MLARTESAISIRSLLEYNEHKVTRKDAVLLDAHNFLQEKDQLTLEEKRIRFQELAFRNERSEKKFIHLSVNFSDKDKLTDRQMTHIGAEFMDGIGFRDQPWLLYRHLDAGHPHFHIVTTNIRPDGSRISNDLRSPHHLMQVCFGIEEKHGLTPALAMPHLFGLDQPQQARQETEYQQETQARQETRYHHETQYQQGTRYLQKPVYGKMPTKKAIEEVVGAIHLRFAYDSFEAYNAVLGLYNVRADRGRPDSPMYLNKGLYYRMIDAQGRKVGAPIKASDFHSGFTLDKVEEHIRLSQERIQHNMQHIAVSVKYCAVTRSLYSLERFRRELAREQIAIAIPALQERSSRHPRESLRRPDDGHGFFYVDCKNFIVIRDTALGQEWTAGALLRRFGVDQKLHEMYEQRQLRIERPSDEIAMRPGHPDTAETRRAILRLTGQHDRIVERQLAEQQQQELAQRQRHGHRH